MFCQTNANKFHIIDFCQVLSKVFESTKEGIIITDDKNHILALNPAFTKITGYTPDEVLGKTPRFIDSDRHSREFFDKLFRDLKSNGEWQGEIWNRKRNGEIFAEWLTINAITNKNGEITNYVYIFSDITLVKLSEQRYAHLAQHDALTGLPNRPLFIDRLELALAHSERSGKSVAVLFIDLDRFKPVNDRLGHKTGDSLLQAVAERLNGCVRNTDTVARYGGDEFTIILEEIDSLSDVSHLAGVILHALTSQFIIENNFIEISASIGISVSTGAGNINSLINNADEAMYQAKQSGGNQFLIFFDKMTTTI